MFLKNKWRMKYIFLNHPKSLLWRCTFHSPVLSVWHWPPPWAHGAHVVPWKSRGQCPHVGSRLLLPQLLFICQGHLDNTMDNIFCPPGPLLHHSTVMSTWGHWRKPPLVEKEKPVMTTRLRTKLGRDMHLHPCSVFKQKSKNVVFKCGFNISEPVLQRCQSGG